MPIPTRFSLGASATCFLFLIPRCERPKYVSKCAIRGSCASACLLLLHFTGRKKKPTPLFRLLRFCICTIATGSTSQQPIKSSDGSKWLQGTCCRETCKK